MVFTIKFDGLSCKFSHHLILWICGCFPISTCLALRRWWRCHFLGRTSTQKRSSMTLRFPGVYQLGFLTSSLSFLTWVWILNFGTQMRWLTRQHDLSIETDRYDPTPSDTIRYHPIPSDTHVSYRNSVSCANFHHLPSLTMIVNLGCSFGG